MPQRPSFVSALGSFTTNFGLKSFSVLLAVILYMFVTVESDALAEVDYPVEVRLDDDEMIVGTHPTSIRATLTGPFAPFLTYRSTDVDPIVVDLRGEDVGVSRPRIDFSDVVTPTGLAVVDLSPQEFEVTIDKSVTRELQVVDNVVDRPPTGFKISEVRLEPEKVEVEGPESMVQALSFVRTRPIEVGTKTETLELEVELQPLPAPQRLKTKTVSATVVISEEFVARSFQVALKLLPESVEASVQPEVVRLELRGPMRLVNQLSDDTIEAVVDVTQEVESGERNITKRIEVRNLPERTSLTALAPEVQVRVRRTGVRLRPAP